MNDGRRLRTIITSTAAVIFCLLATCTGTYAWFITNTKAQMETSTFVLTAEDASIESVLLYKFEYNKIGGIIDYLSPEDGTVNIYSFNEEEGKFGTGTGEGFEPVSVMNLYDPVNLAITDNELFDLNCNVIFKITMASSSMGSASVKVFADRLIEKTKETTNSFSSICVLTLSIT